MYFIVSAVTSTNWLLTYIQKLLMSKYGIFVNHERTLVVDE